MTTQSDDGDGVYEISQETPTEKEYGEVLPLQNISQEFPLETLQELKRLDPDTSSTYTPTMTTTQYHHHHHQQQQQQQQQQQSKEIENGTKKNLRNRRRTIDLGKRRNWKGTLRRDSVNSNASGVGGNSGNNNEVMAKYVAGLNSEQRNELIKTSTDLRSERINKRLELKIDELIDQKNQDNDIIQNLSKEIELIKYENEEIKNLLQMKERDFKLLEKDYTLISELYEEEKLKYETELQKLDKLKREIDEREEELELRAKEQELLATETQTNTRELERHIKSFDGFEENESNVLATPVEQKLYSQFQEEKRKSMQLKQQMEILLGKLEDQSRLEEENQQLKEQCNRLEQDNVQQLEEVVEGNNSIYNEVIQLAHRNARLEQEKQEFMKELENKEYELLMLRKSLELTQHLSPQKSTIPNDTDKMDEMNAIADDIYDGQKNDLLFVFEGDQDQENSTVDDIVGAYEDEGSDVNQEDVEEEEEEEEPEQEPETKTQEPEKVKPSELVQEKEKEKTPEKEPVQEKVKTPKQEPIIQEKVKTPKQESIIQEKVKTPKQEPVVQEKEKTPEKELTTPVKEKETLPEKETTEVKVTEQEKEKPKEKSKPKEKELKQEVKDLGHKAISVPDVLREYLHLTATAVKIKYPKVNIESDELIKRVQSEPYYNYFERMTQIMQAEEAKTRPRPRPIAPVTTTHEGFFTKMRKMFTTPTPTNDSPTVDSSFPNKPKPDDKNKQALRHRKSHKKASDKNSNQKDKEKEKPLAEQPFRSVSPAAPLPADKEHEKE